MKLDNRIKKLIDEHNLSVVMGSLLKVADLEKLILIFSNQCIFKANSDKSKKRRKNWYKLARTFHRAYDELGLERTKKQIFKVARRDTYECQKCKKRFRVDPAKEENCKFDLIRGMMVVTCPNCNNNE